MKKEREGKKREKEEKELEKKSKENLFVNEFSSNVCEVMLTKQKHGHVDEIH